MENNFFISGPEKLDLHVVELADDGLYLESAPDGLALDGWNCLSTIACPASTVFCVVNTLGI